MSENTTLAEDVLAVKDAGVGYHVAAVAKEDPHKMLILAKVCSR